MPRIDCTDLLIRIFPHPKDDDTYPVEATLSDGSFFRGSMRLDQVQLRENYLQIDEYGRILCEALFSGPIGRAYELAQGAARARSEGRLRVRLWIDETNPDLIALPWERLYQYYDGDLSPISATTQTPFSRYTSLAAARPRPLKGVVRVLFAIANPLDPQGDDGLQTVDVAKEVAALCDALDDIPQMSFTILPGQTGLPPELAARLENDPRYTLAAGPTSPERITALLPGHQILHFLGHGILTDAGKPILFMEQEQGGTVARVPGETLFKRPWPSDAPRLVFLASCASAPDSTKPPFSGLGPLLVRAGVPAVVAMQGRLLMDLSPRLQGTFYRKLLRFGCVDMALNAARNQIFDQKAEGWDIPVLYTRLETAQLFEPDPLYDALEAVHSDEIFKLVSGPRYLQMPITVRHYRPSASSRASAGELHDGITSSLADAVDAIFRPDARGRTTQGRIAALIGPQGSNKTTQLKYLIWKTADDWLRSGVRVDGRRLPLYISLEGLAEAMGADVIRDLVLATLGRQWPDDTAQLLEGGQTLPTLRIVFDDIETLSDRQRDQIWRELGEFAGSYPTHEYIVAGRPEFFLKDWFALSPDAALPGLLQWSIPNPLISDQINLHVLIVQPLTPAEIRRFLYAQKDVPGRKPGAGDRHLGKELLDHLERLRLTDLVSIPSFLYRAFQEMGKGRPPRSRTTMLQQVLDMAVTKVSSQHGMRIHAEQTLYRLAWQMQTEREVSWPISKAFAEMEAIRGRRGYGLEDLFGELLKSGALAQVGDESFCFAYPALQDYCCARAIEKMPDRAQVIDKITASLGRVTWLLWWAEPLVCLSGLLQDEPSILEQMLRSLVYGVNLLEGGQSFVAARCLAEVRNPMFAPDLRERVAYSLIWGLSYSNEPRTTRRVLAARALGLLDDPAVIPALCEAANKRRRVSRAGKREYELSIVRLAAAQALLPLWTDKAYKRTIRKEDRNLAKVLDYWHGQQVKSLVALLRENRPETQAIAAFALGDIQEVAAQQALLDAFVALEGDSDALWAVTEGLTLLDTVQVADLIATMMVVSAGSDTGLRRRCLVYLIGRVRYQEDGVRSFLDQGLAESTDTSLIATTLRAVGDLYDISYRGRLEAIAGGDFSSLVAWAQQANEQDGLYLRIVAIEQLARIGTIKGLRQLLRRRKKEKELDMEAEKQAAEQGRADEESDKDRNRGLSKLDEAYYRASEEVAWRESVRE